MKMPDDTAAPTDDQSLAEQRAQPSEHPRSERLAELLRGPFDIKSFALTALFVFALFCIMYLMRPVLLPLVLAILLSYLLARLVRAWAKNWRLPSLFGAGVVLVCTFGFAGALVPRLATPAAAWVE